MSSMILATDPERRILDASPELANSVGSAAKFMAGVDCAAIVRCRNAEDRTLCEDFCPALMALRSKTGVAEGVEVWLEDPSGRRERFNATFQRIRSVPSGMVVAFFAEATTSAEAEPARLETPGRTADPGRVGRVGVGGRDAALVPVSSSTLPPSVTGRMAAPRRAGRSRALAAESRRRRARLRLVSG